MIGFKAWILSLCGATAITSLFRILLSGSSLKKVLNVFFSLFILFYTVIPLQSFLGEYSLKSEIKNQDFDYSEYYKEGFEKVVKTSIENVCSEMSVEIRDFSILSYVNDDGYLCIEKLIIDIDDNEKIEDVKSKLKKQLGYEVNVQ